MPSELTIDPHTVDLDALFKRLHLANARRVWRAGRVERTTLLRDQELGSRTWSIEWMTPFDCITS